MKLDTLAKKTEELQGYVNQLQDAVTIGMVQLRDLKVSVNPCSSICPLSKRAHVFSEPGEIKITNGSLF
jgi:hypothetical protein